MKGEHPVNPVKSLKTITIGVYLLLFVTIAQAYTEYRKESELAEMRQELNNLRDVARAQNIFNKDLMRALGIHIDSK